MAQPRPYERDYDFTSFQVRHATTPPPGNKLDAEFDQIAATIDEVLLRIKDLQRDDLQLANFIVGYDQLKPELRNGFTTPTVWKTATRYAIGASIYVGPKVYAALVAHTSGVFATDLTAGKWHLLADFTIVAGAVQTAVDSAAAAVVSATEAAASAFTASTAAMNAQALLDTIDVNDVTTLAAISADISAAVANAADISTVAGIVSDIPAVAGIAADVTTVAGIAADVTAAVANMAAIIAAPDAAQAAATFAAEAANSADEAAAASAAAAAQVSGRMRRFTTITALKASPAAQFAQSEYVIVEGRAAPGDGGGGVYRYSSADLSSTFVRQTIPILTGEIDAATNKINKVAHGLRTGQGVLVTGGSGLTANTVVYYVRGRFADEFTLHPTYLDAVAATNTIDITGTTAFSVRVLADPDQVAYCTLGSAALDGSAGGFLHSDAKKRNQWHVEWFPGSGPDDTDQINRAALAAGVGGHLIFPLDTLVISNRDTAFPCLWFLSGQTWSGVDRESSIVQLSATENDTRVVVDGVPGAKNFMFRDMCFDGNRDNIVPAPGIDLYTHLQMIKSPSGGKHGRWKRLNIINSWGRSLQTGNESEPDTSEDMIVEDVRVLNAGTKAISLAKTNGGTIKNCYVEVNAYTAAENPAGTDAASGSCFEVNLGYDINIWGNRGKQIGTVRGPGIRFVNGGANSRAVRNSIDGGSYLGFIQNANDVDFAHNVGRNIQGNGIIIGDMDGEGDFTCKRVKVHHNRIVDPTGAYVLITANKTSPNPQVECYIYDNVFQKSSGTPTHGIYNNGVIAPATGGTCDVYAWGNIFEGSIPNQLAGPAAIEIQPEPNRGWQILGQSNVAVSHTGTTAETILANILVPVGSLGKNGRLRVTATWSYTNSANNKIPRIRFGGSQSWTATSTTTAQTRAQIEIGNRGVANSQIVGVPGTANGFGASATAVTTLAINTAVTTSVTLTGELANVAETIKLESYVVEVFYAK